MRQKSAFDRDALHFAPFLLFPSPFPQKEFDLGVELQPILNEVMHRVSHDHKFLQESLEKTIGEHEHLLEEKTSHIIRLESEVGALNVEKEKFVNEIETAQSQLKTRGEESAEEVAELR